MYGKSIWEGLRNLFILVLVIVFMIMALMIFKISNEMNLKDQYYDDLQQCKDNLSSAQKSLKEKDAEIRNLNNVIENRPNYNELVKELTIQTQLIYELKQANLQNIHEDEKNNQILILKIDRILKNQNDNIE